MLPFAHPRGLRSAGAAPDHGPQVSSHCSWARETKAGTVHTAQGMADRQAWIHGCIVPCDPVSGVHAKCQVRNVG